jgi:penicillin-binding protein 1B
MGLGTNIQPTPAVALGAYEMTPVDVAAGYTAFATMGTRAEPQFLHRVDACRRQHPRTVQPADARRPGPPRRISRRQRFARRAQSKARVPPSARAASRLPAAGKTGTSRDGWFAGFTSNLVCVIWVGFDDNRDLGLAGGAAAAPIWADFMIRATALPAYKDVKAVQHARRRAVRPASTRNPYMLATPSCPTTREEVYVAGSATHAVLRSARRSQHRQPPPATGSRTSSAAGEDRSTTNRRRPRPQRRRLQR